MEPVKEWKGRATLVDLLDRVFDKGVVLHADVIISVAGIPLIGVNLRAALAGMETMLEYGLMQSWDERTRVWEQEHRRKKEISLIQGEEIILKMLGAYYSSEGIYTAWRYGNLYLTGERLLLYHEDFGEVLFETSLVKIQGLAIRKREHFTENREREELLYLLLKGGKVARLSALDVDQLKEAIEKRMKELGLTLEQWDRILNRITAEEGVFPKEDETETCPQCGRRALIKKLLEQGCSKCGWVSPVRNKGVYKIKAFA